MSFRIVMGAVVLAILVGLGLGAFVVGMNDVRKGSELRAEHSAAEADAVELQNLLLDIETGARGFVLTGKPRYLAPWREGNRAFREHADGLVARLSDHPRERRVAQSIRAAGQRYIDHYSEPLVALARRDRAAARAKVLTDRGKRLMDKQRDLFTRLSRLITADVQALDGRLDRSVTRSEIAAGGGLAVALLFLAAAAAYLRRRVTRPVEAVAAAADQFSGHGIVPAVPESGPRELKRLVRSFNEMADIRDRSHQELIARNAELESARAEAARANRAKSEFLSGMSHELRTPLNAILGFGQLLQLSEQDPQKRRNIDQILKGGRHLLQLIDEVLQLSRIETGSMSLSPEAVAVEPLLGETIELVAPLVAEHGLTVEWEPADDTSFVLADQQRLKQVVLNLLSNAVKYNRPEGRIRLSVERLPGERVAIGVSDTGYGIPEDKLPLLFSPFERLGADSTPIEGTGLGLALSHRLVTLMGGELQASSQVGVGTTLRIELAQATRPDVPRADSGVWAMPAHDDGGRYTALYIEDNLSNRALLEQIFESRGDVELLCAIQGRVGLDLARSHDIDVILLDLHLPDIPGDQVLAALKADPATADIPVVILTADATPGRFDRLRKAGAVSYLTKPFDIPELLQTLDEVLRPLTPTA